MRYWKRGYGSWIGENRTVKIVEESGEIGEGRWERRVGTGERGIGTGEIEEGKWERRDGKGERGKVDIKKGKENEKEAG